MLCMIRLGILRCGMQSPMKRTRTWGPTTGGLCGLLLLCFLSALDGSAWAETSTENLCDAHPPCSALHEQAKKQSKEGKLTEAVRSYKLAYEVLPDPRLLYNIARVLHKEGKLTEAKTYYEQFLQRSGNRELVEQDEKAQKYLEELRGKIPQAQTTGLSERSATGASQVDGSVETKHSKEAAPASATVPAEKTPVYKKAWFWGVIGGAALAVGLGVGLGVGLRNTDRIPEDASLYEPKFLMLRW